MDQPLDSLLRQCTVRLSVAGGNGHGTGFFVAPGLILTCAHVVKGASTKLINVSWQNQPYIAEIVRLPENPDKVDLALLKLSSPVPDHPCVYLDKSVQIGDSLYSYGYTDEYPSGDSATFNNEGPTGDNPPLLRFKQGQVRPGLSGSPLLNLHTGKVCGIVKRSRDRSTDLGGRAVPTTVVLSQWSELAELQRQFHQQDTRWISLLTSALPQGIPHNILRSGTVTFVGRAQELEALHQQLQRSEQVAISAIAGMGGVGKTELAIQYARSHLQTYQGGICWLQARSLDIGVQIVKFGRSQLNLNPPEDLDLLSQVAFCWRHWPPDEVLVVLDDVTDYKQVKPYLPPESSQFKVLVTTRERLGPPLTRLDLDVLPPEAALNLLRSLVGTERIQHELAVAEKLCEWLGYLPLGLELVGRYLEQGPDLSLAKMLQRLQAKRLKQTALLQADSTMTAQLGVSAAFELSWESLDEHAQQLGCLLSLFALAPIPWSLVESVATEQDPEDLESARAALVRLHLLQRTGEGVYRLHQLIREFLQEKLAQSAQVNDLKQAFATAMVTVAKQIPDSPTRELIIAITSSIPHVKEVATGLTDWLSDTDLRWPFIGLGRFYEGQGFYDQAIPWSKQCLLATQTRFSADHPDVATNLNNLAALYDSQGRYSEAEPLYQQALELNKRLLGDDHPNVALSLNNLAELYRAQGRYSEAEPLYQQALELNKRLLGDNHPNVALSLNNLALLYNSQGRYSEAEPLYLQALELRQRLLGDDHPDVATSLNNLAGLYESQGRYSEVEPLYVQVLAICKRRLGTNHPHTIKVRENLAALHADLASSATQSNLVKVVVAWIRRIVFKELNR